MGNEAIAWIRYQWTSKIENREYLEHYVIPLNQRNLNLINQMDELPIDCTSFKRLIIINCRLIEFLKICDAKSQKKQLFVSVNEQIRTSKFINYIWLMIWLT